MAGLVGSKDDYANLSSIPTADQLTLKLVLEYYDSYIEPYIYTYTSKNEEKIVLKCSHTNFPHLIGLHYAANAKYGRNHEKAKQFRGFNGYNGIKSGNITKQTIKAIYPKKKEFYKDMTKKIRYFYNLHKVLESPLAVYYNKNKNEKKKNSDINCDVLLYKIINNQYIHVGLDEEGGKYVPKTFLIESEPIFIDGQTVIEIEKYEKIRHRKN
ncbi:PBECR4 domain-containing protein [Savagea faecisuis]|uniref:PBECR4 domain-containing protein n=1 Tax=Savagea faecisuis TaxID=1274803 RepID=A0ABW3GVL6_9BACL